ncbi:hypothetical protein WMY93_026315 [Mugilogobius chulae]|uniref:Uncharacterized protein n=1 Tax=Mugilogobius chulae TaxID=88201 RepID=A0AAW0MY42_9GOBI
MSTERPKRIRIKKRYDISEGMPWVKNAWSAKSSSVPPRVQRHAASPAPAFTHTPSQCNRQKHCRPKEQACHPPSEEPQSRHTDRTQLQQRPRRGPSQSHTAASPQEPKKSVRASEKKAVTSRTLRSRKTVSPPRRTRATPTRTAKRTALTAAKTVPNRPQFQKNCHSSQQNKLDPRQKHPELQNCPVRAAGRPTTLALTANKLALNSSRVALSTRIVVTTRTALSTTTRTALSTPTCPQHLQTCPESQQHAKQPLCEDPSRADNTHKLQVSVLKGSRLLGPVVVAQHVTGFDMRRCSAEMQKRQLETCPPNKLSSAPQQHRAGRQTKGTGSEEVCPVPTKLTRTPSVHQDYHGNQSNKTETQDGGLSVFSLFERFNSHPQTMAFLSGRPGKNLINGQRTESVQSLTEHFQTGAGLMFMELDSRRPRAQTGQSSDIRDT